MPVSAPLSLSRLLPYVTLVIHFVKQRQQHRRGHATIGPVLKGDMPPVPWVMMRHREARQLKGSVCRVVFSFLQKR